MKFFELSQNKEWFLVTPSELEMVISGFHLVIVNTGVNKDYKESDPRNYICAYNDLYTFLCSGQKAEWETNFDLFNLDVGITAHLNHISYTPTSHLSVPDFAEPCVTMGAFCVVPFGNMPLTKGWALSQYPENTIGLVMRFPSKIQFAGGKTEQKTTALADYETWNELKKRIRNITTVLKIKNNGKEYNTHIRISNQAKMDLQNFYVKNSLAFDIV